MLSQQQVKSLALRDFATVRDQTDAAQAELQWYRSHGYEAETANGLLNDAQRQFLYDLRNRLSNMMSQDWENEANFQQQVPEINDPMSSLLEFVEKDPELIDQGAVYTIWRQSLRDNYQTCAQASPHSRWWLEHRNDVQAYVQSSSPSLQSILNMLNQIQAQEPLDLVLDPIGLAPSMVAAAPTVINATELAYDSNSYLQNLQLVDKAVNEQLIQLFGKYSHYARRAFQDSIDQAYQNIAGNIVKTFAPDGLSGEDAVQQEAKFFETHLTYQAIKNHITYVWVVNHFAYGNTDVLRYAFVRDLNQAARYQLQSVYPTGIPDSLKRLNFLSPILSTDATNLSPLIQVFMSQGVVAVAQTLHFHEDELAGDANQTAFDVTNILIDQQAQDWQESLDHFLAETQLTNYQDAIIEALSDLRSELRLELKSWQAQHAEQLANVHNYQDLNSLLALDQVHFLNASVLYQRMRQQADWTPVAQAASFDGINLIQQMPADIIVADVQSAGGKILANQEPMQLAGQIQDLLAEGILNDSIKQLYLGRAHDLDNLIELIDVPAGVLYVALTPEASKILASALEGGENTMTDEDIENLISTTIDNISDDAVQDVIADTGYDKFANFIEYCAKEMKNDYADVIEAGLSDQPTKDEVLQIANQPENFAEYIEAHLEDYQDDFDSAYDDSALIDTLEEYLGEITIDNFHDALGDDPAYGAEEQPSGLSSEAEIDYSNFDNAVETQIEDAVSNFDLDFLLQAYNVKDADGAIELIFGDWDNAAEKVIVDY